MTEKQIHFIQNSSVGLLLCFAFLQLNDPDAMVWVSAYLVAALVVCSITITPRWVRFVAGCFYFVVGCLLFPEQYYGLAEMTNSYPEVEQARESFGILIASGILFLSCWYTRGEQS